MHPRNQYKIDLNSILLKLYSVQHWRSAATYAAALGLPNLNYVQELNALLQLVVILMHARVSLETCSTEFFFLQFNYCQDKLLFKARV